jgi:hypothetical protein
LEVVLVTEEMIGGVAWEAVTHTTTGTLTST